MSPYILISVCNAPFFNDTTRTTFRPPKEPFIKCNKVLDIIKIQLASKLQKSNFCLFYISSLIAFNNELKNIRSSLWSAENIRDRQMYLNLKWLIQIKFKNQKIIVWAANNHVSKFSNNKYTSMGYLLSLDSSLNTSTYTIGFTSFSGKYGRLWNKKHTIKKPPNNSFESWVNPYNKYSFIDFSVYNKQFTNSKEIFHLRGWRYYNLKNKQWNRIFDGIFFIRDMYPCNVN